MEMLSFEWTAPPQYLSVRHGPRTWVVVQFYPLGRNEVRVRLTHLGWREGEEWNKVFQHFKHALDTVLGRLEYRFSKVPIDWNKPYSPPQNMTYEIPWKRGWAESARVVEALKARDLSAEDKQGKIASFLTRGVKKGILEKSRNSNGMVCSIEQLSSKIGVFYMNAYRGFF